LLLLVVSLLTGAGCSRGRAQDKPLPDSLKFPNARQREAALVKEAVEQVERAMHMTVPPDLLVKANCRLALEEIRLPPHRRPKRPLALAGFIQTIEGRGDILWAFALNCRRETTKLVIAFPGNDGQLIKAVSEFKRTMKDVSLVAEFVWRVRFEPAEKVLKAACPTESGDFVVLSNQPWPPALPRSAPLVFGVVDRNGTASNFVPVIDLRGRADASPMFKGVLVPPATSLPAKLGK